MLQGWGQDIFSFKSVCVLGGTGPALNSNRNTYCDVKITTLLETLLCKSDQMH